MNKLQKMILVLGLVVFVGMGIYPPQVVVRTSPSVQLSEKFKPPSRHYSYKYDYLWEGGSVANRLFVQWGMVIAVTGVSWWLAKDKRKKEEG